MQRLLAAAPYRGSYQQRRLNARRAPAAAASTRAS